MPKLIVQQQDREWTVELREGSNVIGRSSKNQIPVADTNISREHCEVVLAGETATLVDKGSMNGTLCNGTRVWEKKLEPGDKIQVGSTVLWFEVKKAETPVDTKVRTVRKVRPPTERVEKPPSGGQAAVPKKTDIKRTAAGLVKDYAAWTAPAFNFRLLLPVAGVLLVAGLVAVVMFVLPRGKGGPAADKDNLLREAGGFEDAPPGKPAGWTLRPAGKSSVAITESSARTGKKSIELRKSPDAPESILEIEYSEKLPVGSFRSIEASAWFKSGDFGGEAAVKISWFREGALFFEEFSPSAGRGSSWVQVKDTFDVPPGVKEFRVALAVLGRGGVIQFDDVRVAGKSSGAPRESVAAGAFEAHFSRGGAVSLFRGSRPVLTGLHFRLESDREGATSQLHHPATVAREGDRIIVKGQVLHPVTLAPLSYEMSAYFTKEEIGIGFEFKGPDLARTNRVVLVGALPGAKLRLAPEPTTQIEFESGEEYQIAYLNQPIRAEIREGGRFVQTFPVAEPEGKFAAAFRLRCLAARAARKNPLEAAREMERDRPSKALEILRAAQSDPALDESTAREIAGTIQRLEQRETETWRALEARILVAELTGVALDAASADLDRYDREWAGEPFASKSAALRKRLSATASEGPVPDRGRMLLERARQYLDEGRRALAESLLAGIAAAYPNSEAGEEARKMLGQLRSGG